MSAATFSKIGMDTEPGSLHRVLVRLPWLECCLGLAAAVVVGSWGIIAIAHLHDRFQIGVVSSICVTLAHRLNDGVFYPDLFDGVHYGGTRYMPLSFLLHAGLARITGEYLVAGKLLNYGLAMCLGVELFAILRGLGCKRGEAAALMSLVLLTPAGFLACTTIRADLLAVVMQLGALLVIRKNATARAAVIAGIFCALAVLSKMTAIWAGLAIVCWFLPAGRRRAGLVFAATCLATMTATLLVCNAASSSRMFANFLALAAPGAGAHGLWRAPLILVAQLANGGLVVALLVPAALFGVIVTVRRRTMTVYHVALLFCVPLLAGLCMDPGVDYNHLLDFVVLAIVVTGGLWATLPVGRTVFLSWIVFAAWFGLMEPRLREIGYGKGHGESQYPAIPLVGQVAPDESVLADTPWIELARGQTPRVLDCFAFSRLVRARPALAEPLLGQIHAGAIDKIVLRRRLDSAVIESRRTDDFIFGPLVLAAIAERYCLQCEAEGFFIYVPRERPKEHPCATS